MSVAALQEKPHALYRFFGADGELLYVGITVDLGARLKSHCDEKPWWSGVARVDVEHFASRNEVLVAEREAIAIEHPLHNVVHNTGPNLHSPRAKKVLTARNSQRVARAMWGIQAEHAYAFGLYDGTCPVALVEEVPAPPNSDYEPWLAVVVPFSWVTGAFDLPREAIALHEIRRWREAHRMSSARKRREGFCQADVVFNMDPLARFQTDWFTRHGRKVA